MTIIASELLISILELREFTKVTNLTR